MRTKIIRYIALVFLSSTCTTVPSNSLNTIDLAVQSAFRKIRTMPFKGEKITQSELKRSCLQTRSCLDYRLGTHRSLVKAHKTECN